MELETNSLDWNGNELEHELELGGFYLYLFELAFNNQFYSRTASLFQPSVEND